MADGARRGGVVFVDPLRAEVAQHRVTIIQYHTATGSLESKRLLDLVVRR